MYRSRDIVRTASLAFALLFCGYVVVTVSFRSRQRTSIFSAVDAHATAANQFAGMAEPSAEGSKLFLQEFRRIEIKNGQPAWEVEATDAQHYSKEGVTHLNDAKLIVYREQDSKVRLTAKSAKLRSQGDTLARAELLGDIVVSLDSDLVLETQLALYHILTGKITAPERVNILGEGYSIKGDKLSANLNAQTLKLSGNVVSVFTPGAKAPDRALLLPGER